MDEKRNYKLEAEIFTKAIAYAAMKHSECKNVLRKDGITPYIIHPLRVCKAVEHLGLEYKLTALFHDLLEDTDTTEEELYIFAAGDKRVVKAVKLLTKPKPMFSEGLYIQEILTNPIAKAVKEADRIDNLIDSDTASPEFQKKYLINTHLHYYGKFSSRLDEQYEKTKQYYENRKDKPYVPPTASAKERALARADKDGYLYYADPDTDRPLFRHHVETDKWWKISYVKGWQPIDKWDVFRDYELLDTVKKDAFINELREIKKKFPLAQPIDESEI